MTDENEKILNQLNELTHVMYGMRAMMRLFAADALFLLQPRDPKHVVQTPTHQYSQNYEDAVIAEIFSRIGERSRFFVEIGIETGIECNTRALLERGWRGAWIDANAQAMVTAAANMKSCVERGDLVLIEALVTPDNVGRLVRDATARHRQEIDFLSVDADYNTSHIWRAIDAPVRVACIEYNSDLPPAVEWEVPFDPAQTWDGTNRYGASLKTLEKIGLTKSMNLVGCDFHGVNAFFVAQAECADRFLQPYTAERHFEPPRFALAAHRGHPAALKAP
jgi:hypothetical protein